jgi:hypothetical protein
MSEPEERFRDGELTAAEAERFFRLLANNSTYLNYVSGFDRIALIYREPFAVFLDETITAGTKNPAVKDELISELAYGIPNEILVGYPGILQRIIDLAFDEAQQRLEQTALAQPANQDPRGASHWADVVDYIMQDDEVELDFKKQILQGSPAGPVLGIRPASEEGRLCGRWYSPQEPASADGWASNSRCAGDRRRQTSANRKDACSAHWLPTHSGYQLALRKTN